MWPFRRRQRSQFTKLDFTNNESREALARSHGSYFALKPGERGKHGRVGV
jgi:hypothetical protein